MDGSRRCFEMGRLAARPAAGCVKVNTIAGAWTWAGPRGQVQARSGRGMDGSSAARARANVYGAVALNAGRCPSSTSLFCPAVTLGKRLENTSVPPSWLLPLPVITTVKLPVEGTTMTGQSFDNRTPRNDLGCNKTPPHDYRRIGRQAPSGHRTAACSSPHHTPP